MTICSIDGCERGQYSRGMCRHHHARWVHYGTPERPAPKTCDAPGCDRLARKISSAYCSVHYDRMTRLGSLDLPTLPPKPTCSVDGCDRVSTGRTGICSAHYQRAAYKPRARNANPYGKGKWLRDVVTYESAHDRVRALHGPARQHTCISCGRPAAHWAYDHADSNELMGEKGPYSTNPEHYMSLCVPCHRSMDLAYRDSIGNPAMSKWGTAMKLRPTVWICKACARQYEPRRVRGASVVCSDECLRTLRSMNSRGKSAKLTPDDVVRIKAMLVVGQLSHSQIAIEYGVTRPTISSIACGKNWRHVA